MERLRVEAAKAAKAAQEAAQTSFDKVASAENIAKFKELKEKAAAHGAAAAKAAEEKAAAAGLGTTLETARSSFSNLSSLMRAGDEAAQQQGENSEDSEKNAEDESLMGGSSATDVKDQMKAGLSAFGSKLGQIGLASKARLEESLDTARQAGAQAATAGANVSQIARDASAKSLQAGASVANKGVDGLRTAAAAGSSGVDKLKSATSEAKGALSAAASMSGVNLPGGPARDKGSCDLTYRQRIIGCVCCLLAGTVLSIFSLGSIAKLLLGNPAPFAFK